MQRVLLQDELAEQFGAVHEYHNLRSPIDAIRLLCINYPEFTKQLVESEKNGISYSVIQAGTDLELEDMVLPFGSNDLIITPVITGSGKGTVAIIAGVALIGLAVASGGLGVAFVGTGFTAAAGSSFVASAIALGGNIGIALTLAGISQSLSPTPEAPKFSTPDPSYDKGPQSITRGSDGRQSYAMTGAVNSVGLGATIPCCYGKALIGSHIISADISVTDDSDPLNAWVKSPNPSTMTVMGERLEYVFKETAGVRSRRYNTYNDFSGGKRWLDSAAGGMSISLNQNGKKKIATIRGEFNEQYPAHKTMIALELNNGLYSYVAGTGSTRVDGFVTVKITVRNDDNGAWVGNTQITAQGLMAPGQSYKWINQFQYGKIANKDWYEVYIEIVDYSTDVPSPTILVRQLGYRYVPY